MGSREEAQCPGGPAHHAAVLTPQAGHRGTGRGPKAVRLEAASKKDLNFQRRIPETRPLLWALGPHLVNVRLRSPT